MGDADPLRCFPSDPVEVLDAESATEALLVYAEIEAVLDAPHVRADQPVAFDLDGTVVVGRDRVSRQPGEIPETRPSVAWALGRLLEEGRRVLIVTGRDDGEEAWADLKRALDEVCGRPITDAVLGGIEMRCGDKWAGTKVAVAHKVEALRQDEAALIVGDLDHLDGRAAREAGIPFVDVGPRNTKRRMASGRST